MRSFMKKFLIYSLATFLGTVIVTTLSPQACSAYVYWTNMDGNTTGQANLDGSGINQSWITGCNSPYGVAVDQANPSPIPTLSEWGMIILGILLIGSALIVMRGRQRESETV